MNRIGLIVALAIGALAGVVFGVFPGLDLRIAGYFHGFVDSAGHHFALRFSPVVMAIRDAGLWVGTILVAPAVIAVIAKLLFPRLRMLVPGRAALFLMATMALGPGLLVNVVLKDHWDRSRPIDVQELGGSEHFVAWWDPRGDCPSNCSFVSGDVSGAFWTIAPAALLPLPWRAFAYGAAVTLGLGMALLRMMAGGHFPSDVIFAGVFTFLVIWLMYALIYRWPRTRLTDDGVERGLERFALRTRYGLRWLFRRTAREIAGPEDGKDAEPHIARRRGWW